MQPVRKLFAFAAVATALMCTAEIAAADSTGGASAASSVVIVKRGDRGDAVRKIQSALGVGADGVFGPVTERAVKRFQRSNGLLVDGIVGTAERLRLHVDPRTEARTLVEVTAYATTLTMNFLTRGSFVPRSRRSPGPGSARAPRGADGTTTDHDRSRS